MFKSKVLDEKLTQLKRESEEREAQRRAAGLGLNYVDLTKAPLEIDSLKLISEDEAKSARVAAIQTTGDKVLLAVVDPGAAVTKEIIKKLESDKFKVQIVVGSLSGLVHIWESYRYISAEKPQIAGVIKIDPTHFEVLKSKLVNLKEVEKEINSFDIKSAKTADVLEIIFAGAMIVGASDIHFEAEEKGVRIRYRIDGFLHDAAAVFARDSYHLVVSRIKLLAKLKLNIAAEPQDGRFTIISPAGKDIEVRVSVIPSEFGETIVLRILYGEAIEMSLENLGLRADDLAIITEQLKEPNGMILNTGPTGSGKTTTLYVFLKAKKTPEIKIITIEDPIEYHLEGIEQTGVDRKAGYDFPTALRSILRQDPDVILVGEINDQETAQVGVQAALTGHLVFSTVHANNAPAAVPRLLDLEVKPESIGPAINLIIAQRLARRLCDFCKEEKIISEEDSKKITKFLRGLSRRAVKPRPKQIKIYSASGCEKCNGFGYKDRVGLFELLLVDDAIEKAVLENPSEANLAKLAKEQGMVTVQQDGILKILSGVTTIEEIEAITGPLKW